MRKVPGKVFCCKIIEYNTTALRSILGSSHLCKLFFFCKLRVNNSPAARVYLGVCPRAEPVCGWMTPLGDT